MQFLSDIANAVGPVTSMLENEKGVFVRSYSQSKIRPD
jgi:hypothetical protein